MRYTENRQSMLFSATQTTKVTDLARISLRPGPLLIDVESPMEASTVSTLSQGYVVCPSDRRFLLLFTFLKKNLKKKVIVFFSSCNSVKYHGELLNYIDVPVLDLHVSRTPQSPLGLIFPPRCVFYTSHRDPDRLGGRSSGFSWRLKGGRSVRVTQSVPRACFDFRLTSWTARSMECRHHCDLQNCLSHHTPFLIVAYSRHVGD